MKTDRPLRMQVDAYTRVCLTAIAVLLTVLIVGLWADGTRWAGDARAADQFGDMGTRIQAQLDAQNQTNAKLDALMKLLTSGQVKVQLAGGGQGDGNGR